MVFKDPPPVKVFSYSVRAAAQSRGVMLRAVSTASIAVPIARAFVVSDEGVYPEIGPKACDATMAKNASVALNVMCFMRATELKGIGLELVKK